MRPLLAMFIAAAFLTGATPDSIAHAGACLRMTCTCDDDCSAGFKCSKQGSEMLCCTGLAPTPCQQKPDGGVRDGGSDGDGGGTSGGSGGGCALGGTPNRNVPTGPLAAIVVLWAVHAARSRRPPGRK